MPRIHAEATATIEAAPDQVYAVFADYRTAHPQILPKPYFSDLVVEQGGQGEGTVFRLKVRVFGVEQAYHMVVTEPVPGRTLIETDLDTGLATTFTITPTAHEGQAQVRIVTDWEGKRGIGGLLERITTPPIMRMIYRKELRQLASYLQQRHAQAS